MSTYASAKEIAEIVPAKEIRKKLKAAGVTFSMASPVEKLAEKLYDVYNSDNGLQTEETPESLGKSKWEALAPMIRNESKKVKKGKGKAMTTFIAEYHNFNLSPLGLDKNGNTIRYVVGLPTLDIREQKELTDVFPQDHIRFNGLKDTTMKMGGFIGRSILQTKDELLKTYIKSLNSYGKRFMEYDNEEVIRKELEDDRKITLLKAEIYKADRQDLICTLCYLDMRSGRNTYDSLSRVSDNNILIKQSLAYIEKDADKFLDAMGSKHARIVHLVHLAKDANIIKVTSDGLEVKMAANDKHLCNSSVATNWEDDLANILVQPEGQNIANMLEKNTGWIV